MSELSSLSASQLLDIPVAAPERLFSGDADRVRQEFRELVKRWHPDCHPGTEAVKVMAHILELRSQAEERLQKEGEWRTPGVFMAEPGMVRFNAVDGSSYRMPYLRRRIFELGEMFLARESIAWLVTPENSDLYENARRRIESLKYADETMKEKMSRHMPVVERVIETVAGRVLVVCKRADLVLAEDLLTHMGGRLDARHVAWILSSLHDILCYLQWAGLTHNAISLESCFISPSYHAVSLLGGWWYAAPERTPFKALPKRSYSLLPFDLLASRYTDSRLDSECLRALGRELLGASANSHRIAAGDNLPRALLNWFNLASATNAQEAYRIWGQVLFDSFGPRRFVEMSVNAEEVYF